MQCCTSFLLELGKIKTWQSIDLDQVGDRDVERKDSHEIPHTHTHTRSLIQQTVSGNRQGANSASQIRGKKKKKYLFLASRVSNFGTGYFSLFTFINIHLPG